MSKWLITGDWQATFQNLDTCIRAHGQEMMLAKRYHVKGIIDAGDLKDVYNPIEGRVLEFQTDRWSDIRNNGFLSLINMGNHDRIGQHDDKRNWIGSFKAMGVDAISRPKLVIYDHTIFACLPFINDKKALKKAARKLWDKASKYSQHYRKVLLFHCDVNGADYGLGQRSESVISARDLMFHKWDFSFGGHIHKHQYLTTNAMYVGNPFCFDWGEVNQEKGFILYDDETNTVERLKSTIPSWYTYKFLRSTDVAKVPKGARIKVDVKCKLSEDYYAAVTKKQNHVLKRYPDTLVYTQAVFIDDENKEHAPLIEASASDLDKIKSYVSAKAPESLEQEKTVKYLESVLQKIVKATRSREGLTFEAVKGRRVLSYDKVDFSFSKRGIVLVLGKNKDWPKHSNGSGKTNFLSLLPIALEDQTLKEQKKNSWVTEDRDGKAYVELSLRDRHKNKFLIHRGRKPTKLQFFINGKDESEATPAKTQALIQNVLGFTLQTLKSSVYIDASLPKAFIQGTQKERTDLISRFQNLERFKLARDIVAKDVKHSEDTIESLIDEEYKIKRLVASARDEIKAAKKDVNRSVSKLKQGVLEIKERVKKLQKKRDGHWKSAKLAMAPLSEKYYRVANKESDIAKRIYKVTLDLDTQKQHAKSTGKLSWDKCPTCLQIVDRKHRKEMHAEHEKAVEKITDVFEVLHARHQKLSKRKTKLGAQIAQYKLDANKISEQVQNAESVLESLYRTYKDQKESAEKSSGILKLLRSKLKKAKASLRHVRSAIKTEADDKELLIFGMKAFSRDGIPLYLNSLACPLLNKAAATYSDMFTDGEIQVIFRLNDGEFEPVVANLHGSQTIEGQSTGEMAWAGWIAALALRELAPPTNLLALDEPGYGLDSESAKVFATKLSLLKDKFDTILVVTHNETIASLLNSDKTVTIEKQNKVSKLIE